MVRFTRGDNDDADRFEPFSKPKLIELHRDYQANLSFAELWNNNYTAAGHNNLYFLTVQCKILFCTDNKHKYIVFSLQPPMHMQIENYAIPLTMHQSHNEFKSQMKAAYNDLKHMQYRLNGRISHSKVPPLNQNTFDW